MEKMKATFRRLRFGSDPYEKRISSMLDLTSSTHSNKHNNNNKDSNTTVPVEKASRLKITASSPNLLIPGGKDLISFLQSMAML